MSLIDKTFTCNLRPMYRHLTAFVAPILIAGCISCTKANAEADVDSNGTLDLCAAKVRGTLTQLVGSEGTITDYSLAPRNIADGDSVWELRPTCPQEWCNGFWPGILWMTYEYTGDNELAYQADMFTRALKPILDGPVLDHDLGFLFYCSYGNGYRLTRNAEYRQVLLQAADSLASLYNPVVGTLLAWPRHVGDYGGHNSIIDTMINLELLFWASKNGGGTNLYDIAVSHADRTMECQFSPQGVASHVAVYNLANGDLMRTCTHQGFADTSMWARGQAWAIYGYTMVYRETREQRFLDHAVKVADLYLQRLPTDMVPYWDFDDPRIPDAPRDASAACVVASALLELRNYVDAAKGASYTDAATAMLASLGSPAYTSPDGVPAMLLHSTGHHPAGSEIDASIIYADYYYLEALLRLRLSEI